MSLPERHTPVMLSEVLDVLSPKDGGIYVDATFGAGGYSRALLDAADCRVLGIDRDPVAIAIGSDLGQRYPGRLTVLSGSYGDMVKLLGTVGVRRVDGVAFDLGVSSMQLDEARRGFSFSKDGPLDMRMADEGETAADVVNTMLPDDLADIIYKYGEERASRRIARAIAEARAEGPITRTGQLADIVRSVVRPAGRGRGKRIDPATRTFQALRIHVNDELDELDRGLQAAERLLCPGGFLAVVSFHSLEDRRVKDFLRQRSGLTPSVSRHQPEIPEPSSPAGFRLIRRGVIKASDKEISANPRARSARLRAAERLAA